MLRIFRTLAAAAVSATVLLSATGAGAVSEQGTKSEIESVERALDFERERQRKLQEERENLEEELRKLSREAVEAARRVQQQESRVTASEDALRDFLKATENVKSDLQVRRDQLAGTLAALQRLARRPPEALLAMPARPVDTVRTAILLAGIVPPLEDAAAGLRHELDMLATLRLNTRTERDNLAEALRDLRAERTSLAAVTSRTALLHNRAAAESRDVTKRVASLGQEAQDLRDLLSRLERERRAEEERQREAEARRRQEAAERRAARRRQKDEPTPPPDARRIRAPEERTVRLEPSPPMGDGRVELMQPARGRIVRQFGDGDGPQSQGITMETRDAAQVTAPRSGKVAYVGPFRGYGLLLIIEHGGGYHSLLTGFARIDVEPGQRVVAGEPVGVMGTADPKRPQLYMELRHNGQPINPLPALAARKG